MIIDKSNMNNHIFEDVFKCSGLGVTKIESIPDYIKIIDCSSNELTELPKLPDGLTILRCGDNKLTELPKLPSGLNYLHTEENELTELPFLPDLTSIKYYGNKINYLDNCFDIYETIERNNEMVIINKRKNILKKLLINK